jgi:hypothetical protein
MATTSSRRSWRYAISFLALLGALLLPTAASAATETFERFEAIATANYTLTEDCPDGSTAETLVQVIGGHEAEAESGVTTLDNDFLNVRIFGFDCEFNLINDRGTGEADFALSPSLQRADVAATITTRDERSVTVDMSWEGTGAIEVTQNTTIFPGFVGHFTGKQRDAVATGTVVVDGETLLDGSTTNAEIETLEDKNIALDP